MTVRQRSRDLGRRGYEQRRLLVDQHALLIPRPRRRLLVRREGGDGGCGFGGPILRMAVVVTHEGCAVGAEEVWSAISLLDQFLAFGFHVLPPRHLDRSLRSEGIMWYGAVTYQKLPSTSQRPPTPPVTPALLAQVCVRASGPQAMWPVV